MMDNIRDIAGKSGDTQKPAFFVQKIHQLVGMITVSAHQIDHQHRVDIPAAGAHHQSGERRIPHR
jgi:hypothetical protein